MNGDLKQRVADLEAAVLALGTEEFGDSEGHPFHGNQWSSGGGSPNAREEREKNRDPLAYKGASPPPTSPPPETHPFQKPLTEAGISREVKYGIREYENAISDASGDYPDTNPDDIAHDMAYSIVRTIHPDAREAFLAAAGFPLLPGEKFHESPFRGGSFHTLAAQEFGDTEGHPFHGNQWTAMGGSDKYTATVEPHPWKPGLNRVSVIAKDESHSYDRDSRDAAPGNELPAAKQLLEHYSTEAITAREAEQKIDREKNSTKTLDEVKAEVSGIEEQMREQGTSLTYAFDKRDLKKELDYAEADPRGMGVLKPASGYEVSVSVSALRELYKRSRD